MAEIKPKDVVARRSRRPGEVALFYVLDTPVANAPVAEWCTVRAGKIVYLRAYFDARPFAAPPTEAR